MGLLTRRMSLAAMGSGLIALAIGCSSNMGALTYFLSAEQPLPAKLKHLASKDRKKEPKVVILTYARPGDVPAEFIHADRQLSELLARNLQELAEGAEEKITVIQPRKVEEFKNANPDWRSMDLATVGQRFEADYVIYLELNSLSMYEGVGQLLYRGRANLNIQLKEVNKPDDAPLHEAYTCTFPTRGPEQVSIDVQPIRFRQAFLTHVARQLSWYFSNYPRREQRMMEPILF